MPEGNYVALTVRKLKPGSYDDWRQAWEGDRSDWPDFPVEAYVLRNLKDPDEVIAFGFFAVDAAGLEAARAGAEGDEAARQREDSMAPFIAAVGADGLYEIVDRVSHAPAQAHAAGASAVASAGASG